MARLVLLLLVIVPLLSSGQQFPEDRLEWKATNEEGELIKRTHWQPLVRPTLHKSLTVFYRFATVDNNYYLQLKVMPGNNGPFVVGRNAPCDLMLFPCRTVTVYNMAFQQSCIGGGSRGEKANDPEGVTLTYAIPKDNMKILSARYTLQRLRVYIGEMCFESQLTPPRSKLFTDQVHLIYDDK
jgi:hypothetical protein